MIFLSRNLLLEHLEIWLVRERIKNLLVVIFLQNSVTNFGLGFVTMFCSYRKGLKTTYFEPNEERVDMGLYTREYLENQLMVILISVITFFYISI